jgi:hypothetical protein
MVVGPLRTKSPAVPTVTLLNTQALAVFANVKRFGALKVPVGNKMALAAAIDGKVAVSVAPGTVAPGAPLSVLLQ